jgi:hypothetical protein
MRDIINLIKSAWVTPTPEQLAQRHLRMAELSLLEAEEAADQADAYVALNTRRIERLREYLAKK